LNLIKQLLNVILSQFQVSALASHNLLDLLKDCFLHHLIPLAHAEIATQFERFRGVGIQAIKDKAVDGTVGLHEALEDAHLSLNGGLLLSLFTLLSVFWILLPYLVQGIKRLWK
jgi:hypothetical protein